MPNKEERIHHVSHHTRIHEIRLGTPLLERIGTLETRLSPLEILIKALQKTTDYVVESAKEESKPVEDPNAWAFSASGLQQGPEAWAKQR